MKNATLEHRVMWFLLDVNKLMDGIHVSQITDDVLPHTVKFEARLTCIYANPGLWSPTEKFYQVIMNAARRYFCHIDDIECFNWNNTNTIFWIYKSKIVD